MASPVYISAFVSGEISPSFYGRIDVDRNRVAATTMRNMIVGYTGGAYSRAGTKFCGFSKQTGRNFPPRLLTFQFSINQGLVLEFGNFYMRVLFNGAFVTETPLSIGGVTKADPAVVTFGAEGATAATPNNGGVTFPYAPGDLITLAGGTSLTPAVLRVTSSQLLSIQVDNPGDSYAVSDTITLAGGTAAPDAVATVATLVAVSAVGALAFAFNPSDGDSITLDGTAWTFKTVTSTATETAIAPTLAGTLNQLVADLNASVDANIATATYSTDGANLFIVFKTTGTGGNAYTLVSSGAFAVVSGANLTGGSATGVGTVTITTAGIFTALPAGYLMTQSATSGGGSGASFQVGIFGPHAVTVAEPGAYSSIPVNPAAQATSTGIGQGATFNVTWAAISAFNNGDWIYISGVGGMTELNGNIYVVAGATPTTIRLFDVYGRAVDSTLFNAYTGGGTAARIFTVPTIYAEADLAYLKITQSADVMTICCVNQVTGTEYPPQDLTRNSDTNWSFSEAVVQTSVAAPANASVKITGPGGNTHLGYVVTAVSPVDGSESVASNIAAAVGADLSDTSQATITWSAVPGVSQYNVYKAQPSYFAPVPDGALFGYFGSAYGTSLVDRGNVLQDYAQVPPLHRNPFARGQIVGVSIITGGSGYTAGATATITTGTGTGAVIQIVTDNGQISAAIIENPGQGYQPGDTITIHAVGAGSGGTATLIVGAETGTYPSVPAYFQERRAYGNTINSTDSYFMSQPGAFLNFDSRLPPIDTDAITGSPWAVQVNGIQWMVQTSGGLLVMTGLSAWLLVGAGSFATNVQPISPANQDNVPQAFTGVSPTVVPIKVNYDVLYVNAKGSKYYDLPYQLYALSEPIDLTEISSHLFTGFTVLQNAYCDEPDKVLWAIRDDGVMLSLTYYKTQQVASWARHDTNGLFESCASVVELPVDALYLATQRFIAGNNAYMIERMDNRIWNVIEDCWCVDCGLSLPQTAPSASLTADSTYGIGSITGVTGLVGGSGYSAGAVGVITDTADPPTGSGAVPTLTIVAGVITAVTFAGGSQGSGYTYPKLTIQDPAGSSGGSGASARPILNTTAEFTASNAVFVPGDVGKVIRSGGGVAVVTSFIDNAHVTALLSEPITALLPNSGGQVQPQTAGNWTLTAPVSTVLGLEHLAGATVTGLADGQVITPRQVSAEGEVVLDAPASAVVIGLSVQAQLQSVYLETGNPISQGQRKKVAASSVLLEASRDVKMGANQLDGSTVRPLVVAPLWNDMQVVDNLDKPAYNSAVVPLCTGYQRQVLPGGFDKHGQVALQQDNPLPMNILSIVPEYWAGDIAEQQATPPQQGNGR